MTLDKKITNELAGAEERARAGNVTFMDLYLRAAEGYAKETGQDISVQAAEIRALVPK